MLEDKAMAVEGSPLLGQCIVGLDISWLELLENQIWPLRMESSTCLLSFADSLTRRMNWELAIGGNVVDLVEASGT